jgi:hypothetical protein
MILKQLPHLFYFMLIKFWQAVLVWMRLSKDIETLILLPFWVFEPNNLGIKAEVVNASFLRQYL